MLVQAIDPGAKPGYALVETDTLLPRAHLPFDMPRVCMASHRRFVTTAEVVVYEGQWEPRPKDVGPRAKRRKARVQDIITLAQRAGMQAILAGGARAGVSLYCLPPNVWRQSIGGGSATVCANRIEMSLTDDERALLERIPQSRRADVLAAIGIAWGWFWLVWKAQHLVVLPP
jgi:hypothetical protein